jgi:hypothetical protein
VTPELLLDQVFLSKDSFKVCNLRVDSLSLILHQAALRPQARILIFDGTKGFITGAVVHRIRDKAENITVCTRPKRQHVNNLYFYAF